MQAKIDLLQAPSDDDTKLAEALDCKHVKLPVFDRNAKRQLQLRSDHSQVVQDLKNRLPVAVPKQSWSETIIKSLQE